MNEQEKCQLCGSQLEGEEECEHGDICTSCEIDIHTQNVLQYC